MSPLQLLLDQGDRAALAEQLRLSWRDGLTTAVVAPQGTGDGGAPTGGSPASRPGPGSRAGNRRQCRRAPLV
ncbi:hypothetical protein, partial [Synechococcus sp. CB0205]|uniref:hypothetical protein n=1 Tax=Synechococcus sp. CB0205 TaxID=232363 RepID=UPI0012EADE57